MIEEEEIRMLRKEMVPKAQLMPFFDRPFLPQRSVYSLQKSSFKLSIVYSIIKEINLDSILTNCIIETFWNNMILLCN